MIDVPRGLPKIVAQWKRPVSPLLFELERREKVQRSLEKHGRRDRRMPFNMEMDNALRQ